MSSTFGFLDSVAATNRASAGHEATARAAALASALEASEMAAKVFVPRHGGPPLLSPVSRRMHVMHWMQLASKPPACVVAWTTPGQPTAQLVGPDNALYWRGRGTVVACGVATIADVSNLAHEIGHHRTVDQAPAPLERERLAWIFAREHSLVWDVRHQAHMRRCLQTYFDAIRDRSQVLEVHAIETTLLSEESFRRYQRLETPEMLQAFEDAEFVAAHGSRKCESGHFCHGRAIAQQIDAGRFVCRNCAEWSRVENLIRSQRTRRDAMRHKEA
jgi:hypothetical protein